MKLEELVLRYIALRFFLPTYKKPLAGFLNTVCDNNRILDDESREKYSKDFESAVKTAASLYGKYAFKIFDKGRRVLSSFNAALYDAELVTAGMIAASGKRLPSSDKVLETVHDLISDDAAFRKAITQTTSDDTQVKLRIDKMTKAIGRL